MPSVRATRLPVPPGRMPTGRRRGQRADDLHRRAVAAEREHRVDGRCAAQPPARRRGRRAVVRTTSQRDARARERLARRRLATGGAARGRVHDEERGTDQRASWWRGGGRSTLRIIASGRLSAHGTRCSAVSRGERGGRGELPTTDAADFHGFTWIAPRTRQRLSLEHVEKLWIMQRSDPCQSAQIRGSPCSAYSAAPREALLSRIRQFSASSASSA